MSNLKHTTVNYQFSPELTEDQLNAKIEQSIEQGERDQKRWENQLARFEAEEREMDRMFAEAYPACVHPWLR